MKNTLTKTIDYYDQHADEWAKIRNLYKKGFFWKDELSRFKGFLSSGKILEIGSGIGRDAKELINLGYEYVGIDASKGMLAISKKRLPQADFRLMNAIDLAFPDNYFDGFWTNTTLLHFPKNQVGDVLKEIIRVGKSEGIGFIVMKEGEGEREDETGRWKAYYSQKEVKVVLQKNGFEILLSGKKSGERGIYLFFFVKIKK